MSHANEVVKNIAGLRADEEFQKFSREWMIRGYQHRYCYNFTWLGRPIIQYPQDIVAMQELIWAYKPQLIVETGIAHGGSLIFSASMLQLIGEGRVLGIDIDVYPHNREAIEAHPMAKRIDMIIGSSIAPEVIEQVMQRAAGLDRVMVILDSMHTHDHVLAELHAYSSLVRKGGYLLAMDTIVEHMPDEFWGNRPWSKGNNPMTAVFEFLKTNDRFEIDKDIESKLGITVAPNGFLRCVKD